MTISYRQYREGDEVALEALLRGTFRSFRQSNYWTWKYKLNPNFDPALVVLAEEDGKLIGCNHWLMREIKISSNLSVKGALAADIAVDPAYRRLGIGRKLVGYLRASGIFKEKGIVLSYMFANAALNKGLYQPAAGYVKLPTSSVTYKKLFTCKKLQEKFEEINQVIGTNPKAKKQIESLKMDVSFRLKGSPQFTLHVGTDGVNLIEGKPEKPSIFIEGNLPLSASIVTGDISVGYLLKAWLKGKIKIKKGIQHIFKLRKALRIFQEASNTTS